MVAKRKGKLIDGIPETVCLFNAKEIEYIAMTAKSIPYRVDPQIAAVLVPPDHMDMAAENLHVRHLINKFAFVIQASIGAEYLPGKEYSPELRGRVVPIVEVDEIEMPLKAQVWSGDAGRLYFKAVDKGIYTVQYLGDMKPDAKLTESSIRSMIKSGSIKREL